MPHNFDLSFDAAVSANTDINNHDDFSDFYDFSPNNHTGNGNENHTTEFLENATSQWLTVIHNPDLMLAFSMIIFYLIFVVIIVAIILKIALTILCSGGGIGGGRRLIALMATAGTTVIGGSGETNSDSYDVEMSSSMRTRGASHSHIRSNKRGFIQEMTSFIGGRGADHTNSPSVFDDDDDDES